MTSQPDGTNRRTIAALTTVCKNLTEIRDVLDDEGRAAVARLLVAVPAGDDLGPLLDAVHAALQAKGDALGVYGDNDRSLRPGGVELVEIVYRCPVQRCLGRTRDEVLTDDPHCQISGMPLIREQYEP